MKTRCLYVPDSTLMAWLGTAVYQYESSNGVLTPVLEYAPSGSAFAFYQVSVIAGRGSYWLPTCPQNAVPAGWLSNSFGGVDRLVVQPESTGFWTNAAGQMVMRPAKSVFWLEDNALDNNGSYTPGCNVGTIVGDFPTLAPPAPNPSAPTRKCSASSNTSYSYLQRLRQSR